MVLSNVFHALHNRRPWLEAPEVASPVLPNSPSKSTTSNMPTLTNSIRRSRLMTTKKHTLHDPRTPFPTFLDDVVWNGPHFDRGGRGKDEKDDAKFFAHTELVRPASIIFARHLSRGHSVILVPGQDHDAIQLFVRFLYSGNINSNVADACSFKGGCETLNFKLHDNSFTQLMTPDDEEKLLVKAYLFGYSCSCWTFCDAVIDTLICKIIGQKRRPVLHNLLDLSTNCGSFYPLKVLIAHLALHTWTDNQFCGFALAHRFDRIDHVRFWADVGDYNAVHKTGTYGLPKAPWRKSPCHYHVHASYPKMKYTCYTQSRQG
ncbi:hypothetical protein E4T38_04831 [Aureobasidium subglaciale]|nr:hypothetical protein E4T38_04831 [Aureobasidium subglaciale]KAI5222846.1 hypothetical protein E4T40_04745 [Aureobasidium subglaciale]KAI5226679.1 hypothetical protein E4T41_04688 [Aureobasidium subglaciale]KAI5263139.1 hypothetical protein E4T46_03933 [Aureobasidium subglaciale]